MNEARILSGKPIPTEDALENSLRPKRLQQFIGQEKIKSNLSVFINAAKQRGETLDHVLLKGPPGLGKTTLAHIIANEMEAPLRITSGPAIERAGDLAAILTNFEPHCVLFIDEIHRLNRPVEEILYPAMEDFKIDIVIGKGPGARDIRLDIPKFTLVGATTRAGLLTGPLRDRFGIVHDFEFYDDDSLRRIVQRSAKILDFPINDSACECIATRSRGTPRIANRLLKRVRDFAQHMEKKEIDTEVVEYGLQQLEIDEFGMDNMDRRILTVIIEHFGGGPVGLESIAASLSEDSGTIEEVYEPFLLQNGFLQRTSRGRVAGKRAYEMLGLKIPNSAVTLFSTEE